MRFLLCLLFLTACATRNELQDDYKSKIIENNQSRSFKSKRTTVLFLVDGLSYPILKTKLADGSLPNLKRFFISSDSSLHQARSVFPSLTFPNMASLLKEKPAEQTGAIGNSLFYKNERIRFENLGDRAKFSDLMRGENIFTRLAQKNYFTVSLDYGLAPDASVASEFDFQSGYAVSQTDYRYIDLKKIDALKILLTENMPNQWPDFIFVHLVGLDFLSHKLGPLAKDAVNYLSSLDRDLGDVLNLLQQAEKNHDVVTLLTSDHGFALDAKTYFPLEEILQKINPQIKAFNESRMAALYFPTKPLDEQLQKLAQKLLSHQKIEIVAFKTSSGLIIQSRGPVTYLQLTQNLTSYFNSPNAPDAVVIPNRKTFFSNEARGHHGGPTDDESITPLLIRNATIKTEQVPIWELLKFIE